MKELMTEQALVDRIQNEGNQEDANAQRLTRALKLLSDEIYAKEDRFIYELIQNACDSSPTGDEGVQVNIQLNVSGELTFSHNGKPFSNDDVSSLCDVGGSTKVADESRIGYKGIGFKSVYGQSSHVTIRSGKFHFKFNRDHWHGREVPWQILPIWCGDTPPNLVTIDTNTVVSMILDEESAAAFYLESIVDNPEFILFLDGLSQLSVTTPARAFSLSKTQTGDVVTIHSGDTVHGRYLCKNFVRTIPEDVRDSLKHDVSIPEKMKKMHKIPISFALPLDENQVPLDEVHPVFAFFPTDEHLGLQAIVNAAFCTTASRETLHRNHPWNRYVLGEVAVCMCEWMAQIAHQEQWRPEMLSILPKNRRTTGGLADEFLPILKNALEKHPCIPDSTGTRCVTPGSALYDTTGIISLIDGTTMKGSSGATATLIHADLKHVRDHLDESYGLRVVEMPQFSEIVKQFERILSTPKGNDTLVGYLFSKYPKGHRALQSTAWLLDKNDTMSRPNSIFWPPDGTGAIPELSEDLKLLRDSYIEWAMRDEKFHDWILQIGVGTVDAITLIRRILLPQQGKNRLTDDQCDNWLGLALEAHGAGEIKSDEYPILGGLKVATKGGERKQIRECWVGSPYLEDCSWEELVAGRSEFHFVNERYYKRLDDGHRMVKFFVNCGAQLDIGTVSTKRTERNDLPANYLQWLDNKDIVDSIYMSYTGQHVVSHTTKCNVRLSNFEDVDIGNSMAQRFFRNLLRTNYANSIKCTYYVNNYRGSYEVPSTLYFSLKHQAIWPGDDGACHRPDKLVFDRDGSLKKITAGIVPALHIEGVSVPDNFVDAFGLAQQLNLSQCLLVLDHVAEQETGSPEVQSRISAIYQRLLQIKESGHLAGKGGTIRKNAPRLLSEAGTFTSPKNLHVSDDPDGLVLFGDCERVFAGRLTATEAYGLLPILGVNAVEGGGILLETVNAEPHPSLQRHILDRRYLFALLCSGKHATVERLRRTRVTDSLQQLACTLAQSYMLKQNNSDRCVSGTQCCYLDRQEKRLICTTDWETAAFCYALSGELSRYLGIPDFVRDVDLLLRLSVGDGVTWLSDQGYDMGALPETEPEIEMLDDLDNDGVEDRGQTCSIPGIELPDPTDVEPWSELVCPGNDYSPYNPASEFADGLVALLSRQNSPHNNKVYHFTHVENLVDILQHKRLVSRGRLDRFKDSAGPGLIARTSEGVKEFVRFYFRPKTPTQWHNECLGRSAGGIRALCPVPVFIQLDLADVLRASGGRSAVSNGNLASSHSHYGNSVDFLKYFDASNVYANYETSALQAYLSASQQEFLVQDELDLSNQKITLVCRSEQDMLTMRSLFAMEGISKFENDSAISPKLSYCIDPSFFHPDSPRLQVNISGAMGVSATTAYCQRELEGSFSLEMSFANIDSTQQTRHILIPFDRDLAVHGLEKARILIKYEESGDDWLVYAAEINGTFHREQNHGVPAQTTEQTGSARAMYYVEN